MAEKLMIVMVNTDPGNPAELGAPFFQATVAAAMEQILRKFHDDPDARRRMGDNGRTYAMELYSRDGIIVQIENIFGKIRSRH